MKLWTVLVLILLCMELQDSACQVLKRKKDGENRNRPGWKRVNARLPDLNGKNVKSHSLLTQVLDKGQFLRLGESTTLTPGRNMELRCKGGHIGWSYPTYLDIFNDSRLSITQSDKYSQLVLTSPSAADTGPYSCWVIVCDGAECQRDPDRTYTSYIYFPDKDHLFVPSVKHFEIVYLRPDRPTVVPCRVTEPQAKTSLHREVPPEEITGNKTQMTYDPTKGFVLQHPTLQLQGVFYCKAVFKENPQISTKYQLLYVEVPSGPPFVRLGASPEAARGDGIVNVTCTVLGEPEVDVSFTWSYPGQDQHPVQVQSSWRLLNRGLGFTTRVSQSTLMVEHMDTMHVGNYVCKAKNQHGETTVTLKINYS